MSYIKFIIDLSDELRVEGTNQVIDSDTVNSEFLQNRVSEIQGIINRHCSQQSYQKIKQNKDTKILFETLKVLQRGCEVIKGLCSLNLQDDLSSKIINSKVAEMNAKFGKLLQRAEIESSMTFYKCTRYSSQTFHALKNLNTAVIDKNSEFEPSKFVIGPSAVK